MKFVASRELRINPGAVWNRLRAEKDLVVTSNGKPIGVLTSVDEDSLEDILAILRQGRAQAAVTELRRAALARGADRLTSGRIQDVIRKSRDRPPHSRRPRRADPHRVPRRALASGIRLPAGTRP